MDWDIQVEETAACEIAELKAQYEAELAAADEADADTDAQVTKADLDETQLDEIDWTEIDDLPF